MARNLGQEFMTMGNLAPIFHKEIDMKNLTKMATQDAERWAAAEMAYGEGAGTRRKLVGAEVQARYDIPGYLEAFNAAYESLNMDKFAKQAIKDRKNLDRAAVIGRNVRAVRTGNLQNLSTGVYIVVGGVILARATGYDKKIEAEARKLYKRAKTEIEVRKAKKGLGL